MLSQTCNFSFMNRFTDGRHLPSDDDAIKIDREVYRRDGLNPDTPQQPVLAFRHPRKEEP